MIEVENAMKFRSATMLLKMLSMVMADMYEGMKIKIFILIILTLYYIMSCPTNGQFKVPLLCLHLENLTY